MTSLLSWTLQLDTEFSPLRYALILLHEDLFAFFSFGNFDDLRFADNQCFFCFVIWGKGGCDEEISIFLYRGRVDKEIITQLQGKETGLREHGELIKVRVVPYKNLWRSTADCKVLVAVALFEMATKEGLLPLLAT